MSDAFVESNSQTFRQLVTFTSGFGIVSDSAWNVGSPTSTGSFLNTYNQVRPFGGISGYVASNRGIGQSLILVGDTIVTGNLMITGNFAGVISNVIFGPNASILSSEAGGGGNPYCIYPGGRTLMNSDGNVTINWEEGALYNGQGDAAWGWLGGFLNAPDNTTSLNVAERRGYSRDPLGEIVSFNWNSGISGLNITSPFYRIVTGSSSSRAGKISLNGATEITIPTTAITNNSIVHLTINSGIGTPGTPYISQRTPGVSFKVKSSVSDTSICAWTIFEPV